MEIEVVDFNDRQTTCLSVSCFGLFCYVARDFVNSHLAEVQRVYESRGLEPNYMFDLYHELENHFKDGTYPSEETWELMEGAYIDADDGDFSFDGNCDWAGCEIYQGIYFQGKHSLLSFQGRTNAIDVHGEARLNVYKAICNGLYNCSEPYSPFAKDMMQELLNSSPYLQAMKDLQHAVDLAQEEKILPFGERKWDYDFFRLPFDPAKGIKDMS